MSEWMDGWMNEGRKPKHMLGLPLCDAYGQVRDLRDGPSLLLFGTARQLIQKNRAHSIHFNRQLESVS